MTNRPADKDPRDGKEAQFAGMRCVALCGGVGGAKLAVGLDALLVPENLTIITNTGDDFVHLGLHISPDLDTVMYSLAGLANPDTGWGRAGESWRFMSALRALGGEDWFQLGDLDLATHIERSRRLAAGESLSVVTRDLGARLGVAPALVPMSDAPVRTIVDTPDGPLAFQHYFVRDKCAPAVTGFRFAGAQTAQPAPGALAALGDPALDAIIICPSNPFVSIDPILAVPGMREAIAAAPAPVIAVSPIVGGQAIKGPTAKMMRELGVPGDALAIADHYAGLLDGFVLDATDQPLARQIRDRELQCLVSDTLMTGYEEKLALARAVLQFVQQMQQKAT